MFAAGCLLMATCAAVVLQLSVRHLDDFTPDAAARAAVSTSVPTETGRLAVMALSRQVLSCIAALRLSAKRNDRVGETARHMLQALRQEMAK